tara:strand:- start:304 stop:636 length:333 start_codon:yes stop_codon:yes gene_type:complete
MKVKELIDELKKYNLESNVEINLTDGNCLPIQKIEQDQMEEFSNEYLYLITEGELKKRASKKKKVTIIWETDKDPYDVKTYRFETKEQLKYFMMGVDEGCGWLEYEVQDD